MGTRQPLPSLPGGCAHLTFTGNASVLVSFFRVPVASTKRSTSHCLLWTSGSCERLVHLDVNLFTWMDVGLVSDTALRGNAGCPDGERTTDGGGQPCSGPRDCTRRRGWVPAGVSTHPATLSRAADALSLFTLQGDCRDQFAAVATLAPGSPRSWRVETRQGFLVPTCPCRRAEESLASGCCCLQLGGEFLAHFAPEAERRVSHSCSPWLTLTPI